MAGEEIINTSADILLKLGSIGIWLQAIGAIIVLWIIFQIINWALNRRRLKRLDEFTERIDRIEKKIDRLIKGK
jgi:biopolymer transport protein ExbB/TolQ